MKMKTILLSVMFLSLFVFAQAGNPAYQMLPETKEDSVLENNNELIPIKNIGEISEMEIVSDVPYYFFGEDIFESDVFSPLIGKDNVEYFRNFPILGTYFLILFPASNWLDDESIYILEIL